MFACSQIYDYLEVVYEPFVKSTMLTDNVNSLFVLRHFKKIINYAFVRVLISHVPCCWKHQLRGFDYFARDNTHASTSEFDSDTYPASGASTAIITRLR